MNVNFDYYTNIYRALYFIPLEIVSSNNFHNMFRNNGFQMHTATSANI